MPLNAAVYRRYWQQIGSKLVARLRGVLIRLRRQDKRDGHLFGEFLHALVHVGHVEVAIDLARDARVGVTKDLLNRRERNAGLQQQGRRRVPRVMEANGSHDSARP